MISQDKRESFKRYNKSLKDVLVLNVNFSLLPTVAFYSLVVVYSIFFTFTRYRTPIEERGVGTVAETRGQGFIKKEVKVRGWDPSPLPFPSLTLSLRNLVLKS